jgi:hypothetical protein
MADVSENVSAQLFVKELPPTGRAYFDGARQDFRSKYLTTNVDNVESDTAIENAFQKQLELTEYYKSPAVFDTIKDNYMSKTMDSEYLTQKVDLQPPQQTGQTGSQPPDLNVGTNSGPNFRPNSGPNFGPNFATKSSFGSSPKPSNNNNKNIILTLVMVFIFLYLINLKK